MSKVQRNCTGCGKPLHRQAKGAQCLACMHGKTPQESLVVSGQSATATVVTPEDVRTLDDLVRVCKIDLTEWTVERFVANKWAIGAKDASGEIVTKPLFQIKAWLKRNTPVIDARAQIAALVEDAKASITARPHLVRSPIEREMPAHMLEIAIPDLHLGKLAWAPETGHDHYDRKIAREVFFDALETLLARVSHFAIEQIVFPVGNDFLHSDNKHGTTTKGTPLDNDSRYHRIYIEGRRLLTDAIDRLRQIAPVVVPIVPGNHDTVSAFTLGVALDAYYHATPDVTIDNEACPRKYVSYGRNLLLFTHGDKGKKQNLPLLMSVERPKEFGAALFREAHVGHLHTLSVQEQMGVRVRVSPALCPPDAWHSEHHFVGNLRAAEAIVWSRDQGVVATGHYTVPHVGRKAAA